MAIKTQIPAFEFSGFYYFDILRDILRYLRINVPEITDESDEEAFIQLARAWSLAHHYANVRLDIVANETQLPTMRLLESVRGLLKLIDYDLKNATPAQAELIMQFSSLFTTSTLIVPKNSQFATEDTEAQAQIIYEAIQDYLISRTDMLTNVFVNLSVAITLSNKSGNLFDYVSASVPKVNDLITQGGFYAIVTEIIDSNTIRVNDPTNINNGAANLVTDNYGSDKAGEAFTLGLTFDFGATDPKAGDAIYLLHDSVMWDQIRVIVANLYKTGIKGVWEYYDGTAEDENPDLVTNLGPNLEFDLTTLLGEDDRSGTVVQITYAQTAVSEQVVSQFVGNKNIARSTGLLGQITPSEETGDYLVGSIWAPLEMTTNTAKDDGEFSVNGVIEYDLPQTLKQNWAKTTINGKQGWPLRFRVQSLEKKAATITGTGFNPAGLDTNNYRIKVGVDAFADTEIDVTGDLGVSGTYTGAGIAAQINSILSGVDISLASFASYVNGQLKFTAPNAALGKDSEIRILAPSGQDALNELLGLSESGYPYSVIGVGGKAVIDQLRIDEGLQYLLFNVVQGRTVQEQPLASSDGSPNQEYTLGFTPLIDGTLLIEVDEGAGFTQYDELKNFLSSDGSRKGYTKETNADDETVITFGDGVNGKIPPPGVDNIRATYRIGADQEGNVGAHTINVNLAGISFVTQVYNPRQASGWAAKQGSDEESLAKAKIEGPASLRTLGKAITPSDIETLAVQFTSPSTNSAPVVRAQAIEETFGVKTVELVVVGPSGTLLTQTQRDELDDYFNGNKPLGIEGVLVTNHEVTTVNFTPKPIDVTAVVTGTISAEAVKNALSALLNPEAKYDDDVTYRWDFGGEIPVSLIIAAIHEADQLNVKKVQLTVPAANIILGTRELPVPGNFSITIVAPS